MSTLLWNATAGEASPLCGASVLLTNTDTNVSITAVVGDASGKDIYTTLSKAAFSARTFLLFPCYVLR